MSIDTIQKSVLVVCHESFDRSVLSGKNLLWLEYSFVESFPQDGFSAWRVESSSVPARVEVADGCRLYQGGFSQQALNRFFSDVLIGQSVTAVVIAGLCGCTVDLPRVAAIMGVPSLLILDEPAEDLSCLDNSTEHWLRDSLAKCQLIIPGYPETPQQWPTSWIKPASWGNYEKLEAVLESLAVSRSDHVGYGFDYSTYEFCQRDHPLLKTMQWGDTTHFAGCKRVLDLGCGVGIFLDCLRQQGINGVGVERDPAIAEYGSGMGLNIINADALDFLEQSGELYDGIYCSHFVEHLPFDVVQKLIHLLAQRLVPGGVVVLAFPDPESIRSQLLGFWRDPEHVRFYHPELITALASSVGLELEWSSYDAQPHQVVPFTEKPTAVTDINKLVGISGTGDQESRNNWFQFIMSKLGFISLRQFELLERNLREWSAEVQKVLEQQRLLNEQLKQRTDSLWDVNKTWAWNDNATLKLRKRAGQHVK